MCVCARVCACVSRVCHVCVCVCVLAICKWPFACVLATGWRRPIGYLKLQVIFRNRATNFRALLQKMTYKDKAS